MIIKKLKSSIKLHCFLASTLLLVCSISNACPTFAAPKICDTGAPSEVKTASGCGSGSNNELSDSIVAILNGVIGFISIVAVAVIVVGGINYMTSAGDTEKVKRARNTILYAGIGLVICALAFAIVNFVVGTILKQDSSGNSPGGTNQSQNQTT